MPYSWHEEFFKKKVLPGLLQEMQPCAGVGDNVGGFFAWLQMKERGLYDEIKQAELKIDEIWLKQGDRDAFKETCIEYVKAHLAAKPKYLAALGLLPAPKPTGPAQGRLAV